MRQEAETSQPQGGYAARVSSASMASHPAGRISSASMASHPVGRISSASIASRTARMQSTSAASVALSTTAAAAAAKARQKKHTVSECIDAVMDELTSRKGEILLSDMLANFKRTSVCSDFLHSLESYMRAVTAVQPALDEPQRQQLLLKVAVQWSRVLFYCSNFESTTADAVFFESLLLLARCVCHMALADASAKRAAAIDAEFFTIFRGGIFDTVPLQAHKHQHAQLALPHIPERSALSTTAAGSVAARVLQQSVSLRDSAKQSEFSQPETVALSAAPFESIAVKRGGVSSKRFAAVQRAAVANLSASEAFRRAVAARMLRLMGPTRPTQRKVLFQGRHRNLKCAHPFSLTAGSPCVASLSAATPSMLLAVMAESSSSVATISSTQAGGMQSLAE
jgi:hypothetical protein